MPSEGADLRQVPNTDDVLFLYNEVARLGIFPATDDTVGGVLCRHNDNVDVGFHQFRKHFRSPLPR